MWCALVQNGGNKDTERTGTLFEVGRPFVGNIPGETELEDLITSAVGCAESADGLISASEPGHAQLTRMQKI